MEKEQTDIQQNANERSVYALLIGMAVGFAGGAYLFSKKESPLRARIEEEISNLDSGGITVKGELKTEVNKMKQLVLSVMGDLSERIKKSMEDEGRSE